MTVQTLADIVGPFTGPLNPLPGKQRARHIYFTSIGGVSRWGDASVGANRGSELPSGVPVVTSANEADISDTLDLGQVNVYVPSSSTLTITLTV